MKAPCILTTALAALMVLQSVLGLVFQDQYRDVDWIKAAWFGNDWVTLVVAVPLLVIALVMARRGSVQGLLSWLGLVGYAVYNYAYYLLGAALNAFFLLYVVAFVVSAVTLIVALSRLDASHVAASFLSTTPVRIIGGYLAFVGLGLAFTWVTMWAAYAFANQPTPVEPEAFKLVAALDISLMVTGLTFGGVLLWRRKPLGYVIAAIASIQASLYLLALSVNSIVAIHRGLAKAPGEVPIWGTLAALTTAVTLLLLTNIRRERGARNAPTGSSSRAEDERHVCDSHRTAIRYSLGGLLAFGALNAFGGGYYGLSGAEGVPTEWLEGSPFPDYFVPSLILLVVVGGSFLIAAIAVVAGLRIARRAAFAAGIVVLGWLAVQLTIIGYVSWMQPTTAIAGVLVLLLGALLPPSQETARAIER